MVMEKMQKVFEAKNPGYIITYTKLMPTGSSASIYEDYPVQKLTLVKENVSSDIADTYSGMRPTDPVNLEVSLVARRNGSVGSFGSLAVTAHPHA